MGQIRFQCPSLSNQPKSLKISPIFCFSKTAEDIFAVTAEYEVLSVPDGRTLARGRDDLCHQEEFENLCTIPSGGE